MTERCANHPERDAEGTCARCGNFICDTCRVPGSEPALCASCDLRLGRSRLVGHVPVLGIVLIIHGVLTTGMGLFMLAYGGFFMAELSGLPQAEGAEDADFMSGVVLLTFVVIALTHMVPGLLQAWAGWRLRTFRGRTFGIVALCLGLVTFIGCYCGVTSTALLIWGLIVLANAEVARRFAMPGTSAS